MKNDTSVLKKIYEKTLKVFSFFYFDNFKNVSYKTNRLNFLYKVMKFLKLLWVAREEKCAYEAVCRGLFTNTWPYEGSSCLGTIKTRTHNAA